MTHYHLLRLKLNTLGSVAGASTHTTMGSTGSAGPVLAPAQDKADSVSLTSAGPALAPAQGKADSEALASNVLALNRSASGLFLKTRMVSAHLWSLNYKPWGRGVFATAAPAAALAFVYASARDEGPEGLGGVPASVWYERRRARLCTFDLVWLSGDVIKQYTEEPDRIIDRVRQDISEGLLGDHRVAHAQIFDTGGNWLGSYINGQWVSACTVPSGATLTVIRRKTKANDPASQRPMCYKCRDFWDVEDDNTALECGHDTLCMRCYGHFCGRSCPFKCRIVDEEAEQQRAPLTDGLSAPSGSAG